MTWTRLPDTFNDDPRLAEVSRDARLLHAEALVYGNKHLTDGVIPCRVLARITDSPDASGAVAELVAAELWTPLRDRNAWQVDWADQEPAETVLRRRDEDKARQKRQRSH